MVNNHLRPRLRASVLWRAAWEFVAASPLIFSILVFGAAFANWFAGTTEAFADELFRVAKQGDKLVIPVSIDGHESPFVVDTGNSTTTLHTEFSKTVGGITQTFKTFDGYEFSERVYYEPPPIAVGRLKAQVTEVGVVDLDRIRRSSGYPISGILGMDFLQSHVLSIDYDRGELRLHESPATGEFVNGFRKRCVLTHNPNTVVVYNKLPGSIVGDLETFVIDTGMSASLVLREELFDALVQSGAMIELRRQNVVSTTKTRESTTGSLRNFEFAGVKHQSLRCGRAKMNLIGQGLLARYQVTMDFPRGEIWLRPGARIDLPDPVGIPGIGVARAEDDTVVVSEIERGGIGEQSGILVGDQLLAINGEDLAKLPLFQIRRKFTEPGECRLKFRRQGQVREQVLQLAARNQRS